MESRIWTRSEEKWAYLFMLRGDEIYHMKITGNMLTLKGKVARAVEGLEQGRSPSEVGAKRVEALDVRTIRKVEISPGNGFLTFHGAGEEPKEMTFVPAEDNAEEIFQAIQAQSGRTFHPAQEEVGVGEALLPPLILGALLGFFWVLVYMAAGQIASGELVEAKGIRRRGLQTLMMGVAQSLGMSGTMALGAILLVAMLFWAALRVIHRPERTVWVPETV